jgi:glycosyltransferase involved in cell wall biosynthesis
VSVVIPTYRRRDSVADVVAAIAADPYATEIVVVVDGSDDGSYELLQELAVEEPRIRPVWRDNGGEAAARQTGVEHATGDVVLLLDDDVLAGPRLVEGHARRQAEAAGRLVLGYMPTDVPPVRRPGDFATRLYAAEYEAACARYEQQPGAILIRLWAGNMSLWRSDALHVGLDGGHRMGYHDDREFGLRCQLAGLSAVFDRTLSARHTHSRDLANFIRQARLAGAARRHLARRYPHLVDDVDPSTHLRVPLRAVVRAAATPALHRAASAIGRAGVLAAGSGRMWAVEVGLARLLRQVELLRGYRGPPAADDSSIG